MTILILAVQAGLGSMLLNILVLSLVLMGAAYLLSGVIIKDFTSALIVALVLAILNATLGKVLDFFFAPLSWITLGFFSLVIDAALLMIADYFLKGLAIKNFTWALLMAIVVAIANVFLHVL